MNPVDQAFAHLAASTSRRPSAAVVLGSGLGAFASELSSPETFPYSSIPAWPASTAIGHQGALILGRLGSADLAVMSGRCHLYEGYSPSQVVLGVRVLAHLGVRTFLFTNAAGGINPAYSPGSLVLISDHVNLQGSNPLTGPNDDSLGPRFPDMTAAYDPALRALARSAAASLGFDLPEGVYAAMHGPSYETPAEIRFLRAIGCDLVGMSTVPEVIAARHLGLRVLAVSCVTNLAAGLGSGLINHQEVLDYGLAARARLVALLKAVLSSIDTPAPSHA